MERFKWHLSDALEIDGVRQFRLRKPCPGFLAASVMLLEVDVDRDSVVALSHNRVPHNTVFRPFIFGRDGLHTVQVELDGILERKLGFWLLDLELHVHGSENGTRFGETSRATYKSGRHA